MRRLIIAALVVAAATAGGSALAAGGGLQGARSEAKPALAAAACHCKRGPRGPRGVRGPEGAQGPQGPTGAQGPQGPAGSSTPIIYAVVDADGTLAYGTAVSVSHTVSGEYTVTFARNVDNCAVVAAPGSHRTTGQPAIPAGFANASTDGNAVTVITRVVSPPGVMQPTDRSFHVIVMCSVG
jgi:hypothetical protein